MLEICLDIVSVHYSAHYAERCNLRILVMCTRVYIMQLGVMMYIYSMCTELYMEICKRQVTCIEAL